MKHFVSTALVFLLLSIPVFAQSGLERQDNTSSANAIGDSRIDNKFSLFDLSRFEMHNSYTLSYFSSGGRGMTIGMYMNSIIYRISNPLTLHIDLAWVHQPGNLFSSDRGTPTDYGSILPSFTLTYHPSDKFYMEIGYRSIPGYMYYGLDRWGRDSYYDRLIQQK